MDNGKSARAWFLLAGLFAGLFALNVALRMLFIKLEVAIWRLGDVGEFLLVLVAMVFFVAGVLTVEEPPESSVSTTHEVHKGGSS